MGKTQQATSRAPLPLEIVQAEESQDALLAVREGGKIVTMTRRARQIFTLDADDVPNLERLARKIRPSEEFMDLCAHEGQARLVLSGRMVDAQSYRLSVDHSPAMVVNLHFPELTTEIDDEKKGIGTETLQIFSELSQTMVSSLDFDVTLQAVQQSVEKLIPTDFLEITIWDSSAEALVPYRFVGLPGAERKLEQSTQRYKLGDGYSGYVAQARTPLLIEDIDERRDLRPAVDRNEIPIRSYMGAPLLVGNELVGTLDMGSLEVGAYQKDDLNLLALLAGQAAVALRNAVRYRAEKKRTTEMAGLAQLAQTFSLVRDPKNIFGRLVESIQPLIPVEILGFLIYNESTRMLEGQAPFSGLPTQIVDMYHASVLPGSAAEVTLLNQDVITTENASESKEWENLGLAWLAQAASLHDTVLIPLNSGGRMLGYLQASNHKDGSATFTMEELRLLMIVSNQAAPIIENATLVMQSRNRAQRAEGLRRIASLASSAATLDEILSYSLGELGRLLLAGMAGIFLVDTGRRTLKLHQGSFYGLLPDEKLPDFSIHLDDPQFPFTVTGSQHPLVSGNLLEEKAVIPYYQGIINQFRIVSAVAVPLVVRNEGIGELWFGSTEVDSFDQGELQLVTTAAGQLAGVVEQSSLRAQTDESLQRRIEQLTAVTRISRELSTSLDLSNLLQLVYSEALLTTRADCGSILLFDAGTEEGQPPKIHMQVGDAVEGQLSPMLLNVLESSEPLVIADTSQQQIELPHAEILSLLAVPVRYQNRAVGLIVLHSKAQSCFDQDAISIALSLGDQAAVAFGNAVQFEDQLHHSALLKRELDTLAKLFQVAPLLKGDRSLAEVLGVIATAIQEVTPFQAVVVSLYDPKNDALQRTVGYGLSREDWQKMRAQPQPWKSVQAMLQPEFRFGNSYYIPADRMPVVPADVHAFSVLPPAGDKETGAWDPDDFLLVPLYSDKGDPLGLISLDAPADRQRPDRPTFEALDLFAAQACLMIENNRRISRLEAKVAEMGASHSRLAQASDSAQESLPILLRHDLEHTVTIQGLHHQMDRARAGLEMAELANRQQEPLGMLRSLAQELMARFDLGIALIAEKDENGLRLMEVAGNPPPGVNVDALFGQKNPLRQMLQDRKPVLIANLENDKEWQNNAFLTTLGAKCLIGLPVHISETHQAGVLATGAKYLPPFKPEDDQVFGQLSRQVSIGAQNLELLKETRRRLREVNLLLDFTRKIDVMDLEGILRTLTENALKALPAAQAGWVALWDEKSRTLTPHSASGYADSDVLCSIQFSEVEAATQPLPLRVFTSGEAQRKDLSFAQDYNLSQTDLLLYRQATGGRLPVSSLVVPLKRGQRTLGVMTLDNLNTSEAFSPEDEALALSLAQQTALALESARLFVAADRRANQLRALTEVAGTITSSLQRTQLMQSLLDLFGGILPYDTATLWLREDDHLRIQEAKGFAESSGLAGLTVSIQDSGLFQEMIKLGQPIRVPDVRQDPRFPSMFEHEYLSWLGMPLVAKGELVGVIALEKKEPDFYTSEHLQLGTTFASQAAIALENARLFEESTRRASELDERSQRLALLNRLSSDLSGTLDINRILSITGQQLLEALHAARVAAVLVGDKGGYVLQSESPAGPDTLPVTWPEVDLLAHLSESQGIFSCADVEAEPEAGMLAEMYLTRRAAKSFVIVPLVSAVKLHGWLVVQKGEVYRFSPPELELARTVANQAAIAIQTARLYQETLHLTEDLEKRVEERTVELRREHNNTETLLRIITELSNSLDLDHVITQALTVLNDTLGAQQSLIYLSQSRRIYQCGKPLALDESGNISRLAQEIARWVIRRRAPALVDNLAQDSRWKIQEGEPVPFASLVAVPLVLGEEITGALLLLNEERNVFLVEQLSLLEATARQFSITLNNSELFKLIRDQAENLGGMLRTQQMEASRSRAILESVADGVLVTDAANNITLCNASTERILDIKAEQVLNQPLEQFASPFEKASRAWLQTIFRWSRDPHAIQGETFAERLELDNGKVVSVTLAPVFFRSEFLATVSIFRDVTHEVQVDRLKSEFIANVSHELRTPMTSIKGYVEVMLMGVTGQLNTQQERFLKIIKSNTERLNVLVNDILDVSRIESGRLILDYQLTDIVKLATMVVDEYQRRAQDDDRTIEFALDTEQQLPQVMADPVRLRQIISSLVSNGYNYTPNGGHVALKLRLTGDTILVEVKDDGIGITEKDARRIFERFFRGEDPMVLQTAGTGLGLAISKILVEMHGGKIWFESKGVHGEGSKFSFSIPVAKVEE